MDAIKFILNDHKKIRRRFKNISKKSLSETKKKQLFSALCRELVIHENMEHQTWYPHFKKDLKKLVKHLLTEEKDAAKMIKEFKRKKSQEFFDKKFPKFKKDVEKHAREEERKLFPKVRKLLDSTTLQKIGKKMRAFKKARKSKL